MSADRSGRIFISYRRQETAWPARQLYDVLVARFGAASVFKDVDDIEPGDDFVDRITEAVAACDVLLALIGPHWLTMTDEQGRRRLDNPDDFVRLELKAALSRGVRVVPILVDGARMPPADQLPADLVGITRRQAVEINPVGFNTERLLATLASAFARTQGSDAPGPQRSEPTNQPGPSVGSVVHWDSRVGPAEPMALTESPPDPPTAPPRRTPEGPGQTGEVDAPAGSAPVSAVAALVGPAQSDGVDPPDVTPPAARVDGPDPMPATPDLRSPGSSPEVPSESTGPTTDERSAGPPTQPVQDTPLAIPSETPSPLPPTATAALGPAAAGNSSSWASGPGLGRPETTLPGPGWAGGSAATPGRSAPEVELGTGGPTVDSPGVGGPGSVPPPIAWTPAANGAPKPPGGRVFILAGAAVLVLALVVVMLVWRPWRGTASPGIPSPMPVTTARVTAQATGSASAHPIDSDLPSPPIVAHRGGLEVHQFETQQAMEAAARAGFAVETDVRYTSDGVAVLVHDERATKGLDCGGTDIQVSKTSWSKLRATCRSKPTAGDARTYEVPTLDNTLEAIAAASPDAWVFLEVKTDQTAAQRKAFLAAPAKYGLSDRTVITSAQPAWLRAVRDADDGFRRMLFVSGKPVPVAQLKGQSLWGVAVEQGVAKRDYVQQLKAAGLKVMVWVVNDPKQWATVAAAGPDLLMTAYPAKYQTWSAGR